MELRNISCSGDNTQFQILDNGKEYLFDIPNQAIIDFQGEMVDCPEFVIENAETFKAIAKQAIDQAKDQDSFTIDYQTIVDNFY